MMSNSKNNAHAGMVIKLSASDMLRAEDFYTKVLGCTVDDRYTLTQKGQFGAGSYLQLDLPGLSNISLGLYKDIDFPLPAFSFGTVPTIIVDNADAARDILMAQGITCSDINEDKSDAGYRDRYFFFADPDNNSLAMRQNLGKA